MSTLLVDNYDSYTYNVFHLLAAVSGEEPIVVHNDMVSWRALSRWDFDAIVLSPGPGRPQRWHDFGVCADILRFSEAPVLGVCLGHQGIGNLLNGDVADRADRDARAPQPGAPHDTGCSRAFRRASRSCATTRSPSPAPRARRARDRLDRRRRRDGHRARTPPAVGRAVPPRVDRHRARARSSRTSTTLARQRAAAPRRVARRSGRRGRRARSYAGPACDRAPVAGRSCELRVRSIAGEPSTEPLFERLFGEPSTRSGSTAPTRRRRSAQCSYLGTSAGKRTLRARLRRRRAGSSRRTAPAATSASTARSSTCSTASSPRATLEPPSELAARPARRLRRLSRLRVQGRLRLAQRAPLGPARRGADARQPPGRRRPRRAGAPTCLRSAAASEREAERWLDDAEAVVRELLDAPGAPRRARPPMRARATPFASPSAR